MDGDDNPSVTDMLGSAGACPEIKHNGKTWRVGHPTQRAKATLEVLAADVAIAEVEALEATMDPKRYAKAYKHVMTSVQSREYRTWGEGWQKVVWGPMSSHLFLFSLIRENHPDATEANVIELMQTEPTQVARALAQVVPPFVRLLLSERRDIPPKQREELLRGLTSGLTEAAQLNGLTVPSPPVPTPATSAVSSTSGTKSSRKSRGVTTPTR